MFMKPKVLISMQMLLLMSNTQLNTVVDLNSL